MVGGRIARSYVAVQNDAQQFHNSLPSSPVWKYLAKLWSISCRVRIRLPCHREGVVCLHHHRTPHVVLLWSYVFLYPLPLIPGRMHPSVLHLHNNLLIEGSHKAYALQNQLSPSVPFSGDASMPFHVSRA